VIRRAVVAAFILSFALLAVSASRRRVVEHPGVNAPHASPDSYSVLRGQTLTVSASSGVLANDTDPLGKALTASVAANPTHGTLSLNANGGFTYVNDGSSATSDSFTYTASNGAQASAPATVTIAITGNPPVAAADAFSVTQGQTLTVAAPGVLTNDVLNGAAISSYGAATGTEQTSVGSDTATAHAGTVNLRPDGSFTYTPPNSNFAGTDTFMYAVTNPSGTSTSTVTITVTPAAPVATADSYSTPSGTALVVQAPGVLANDSLNGATIFSYGTTGVEQTSIGSAAGTAQGGSVVLGANGGFTYNAAASFSGSDTFKYVLRNSGGNSSATVTLTVTQVQTGPDFTVTSPGFFYSFAGMSGENPTLTLTRGRTYTFKINTDSIHPFEILDEPSGTVTNNNISSGTITFRVPAAAANYRYICSIHGFGGTINTVP
jgi:large repetitive protein